MHFSRRKALSALGAVVLMTATQSARAQTAADYAAAFRPLFVNRWDGSASTPDSSFEGGEFAFGVSYYFDLRDDLTFSGDYRITTRYEGNVFHGTYHISGDVTANSGGAKFNIRSTSLVSGDSLPSRLFWQGMTGTLSFYKDSDDSQNYLLRGTLYGERDNVAFDVGLSYR